MSSVTGRVRELEPRIEGQLSHLRSDIKQVTNGSNVCVCACVCAALYPFPYILWLVVCTA